MSLQRALSVFWLAALVSSGLATAQDAGQVPEPDIVSDEILEQSAEEGGPGYVHLDAPVIQERLEDVLSRPEFARLRAAPEPEEPEDASLPEWLERFADWLGSLVGNREREEEASTSPSFRFGSGGFLLLLMPAAIVLAALVFVVKAVVSSAREKRVEREASATPRFGPGSAPGEMAPAEYWRKAQELAEARDYRGAIRLILLAAMSTLERRGLVRFRKGLTNRDYVFASRGPSRESMVTIVRQFEHVYFGRREATAEGYSECRRALEKGFPMEAP